MSDIWRKNESRGSITINRGMERVIMKKKTISNISFHQEDQDNVKSSCKSKRK